MTRSEEQWRSMSLGGMSDGNRLVGSVYKGSKFWVAKLPARDVMTQGRSKDEAHAMVKDMLETLVRLLGFSVRVNPDEQGGIRGHVGGFESIGALPGVCAVFSDQTDCTCVGYSAP